MGGVPVSVFSSSDVRLCCPSSSCVLISSLVPHPLCPAEGIHPDVHALSSMTHAQREFLKYKQVFIFEHRGKDEMLSASNPSSNQKVGA